MEISFNSTQDLAAIKNNDLKNLYIACGSGSDGSSKVITFGGIPGEISTFDPGNISADSVDLCDDGTTVLIGTKEPAVVKKLVLTEDGTLDDTGQYLDFSDILGGSAYIANVYCAPGSKVGAVVTSVGADLISFTVEDMEAVERRDLKAAVVPAAPRNAAGISGAFTSEGHFFVRSSEDGGSGYIEKFDIDFITGIIGPDHSGTVEGVVGSLPATHGIETFAIYEAGDKIFIANPSNNKILIKETEHGDEVGEMTDELFNGPTTISIVESPE